MYIIFTHIKCHLLYYTFYVLHICVNMCKGDVINQGENTQWGLFSQTVLGVRNLCLALLLPHYHLKIL